MQNWELIVQLIAKCAGHVSTIPIAERDDKIGILHSQHCLSQITEMIRTAYLGELLLRFFRMKMGLLKHM